MDTHLHRGSGPGQNSLVSLLSESAKNSACGLDSVGDADLRPIIGVYVDESPGTRGAQTQFLDEVVERFGPRGPSASCSAEAVEIVAVGEEDQP